MVNDSFQQVAAFQKVTPPLSVKTKWTSVSPRIQGSVNTYLKSYQGSVALEGVKSGGADIINGGQALSDPSNSNFWNFLMNAIKDGYNQANNVNYGLGLDFFHITDPPIDVSNKGDAFEAFGKLLLEIFETLAGVPNASVHIGGQFKLDLQTGGVNLDPTHFHIPPPDPRPVFNWSMTLSLDSNAHSLTFAIDIKYDHMEVNTILDQVLIDLLSTTLLGGLGTLVLAGAVGAAGGLAVGPILANFFTNYADQQFSSGLNSASAGWAKSNVFVVGPVQLSEASPSNGEFLFSATFTFTPTTWEGIFGVVQGALDNIPSS